MKRAVIIVPFTGALIFIALRVAAQSPDTSLANLRKIPASYLSGVQSSVTSLDEKITSRTQTSLQKMQAEESKISSKLAKVDSLEAYNLFSSSATTYQNLENKIQAKVSTAMTGIPGGSYIAKLDTLKSSLDFLNKYSSQLSGIKNASSRIQASITSLNQLENKIQSAQQIEQYLEQRQALLTQALAKYGTLFNSPMGALNQQIFYYGAQLRAYKEDFQDPSLAEAKAFGILEQTRAFNSFMQRNSMLAGFFDVPADYGTSGAQGLQTLAMVQKQIQSKIAGAGPGASQQVSEQFQGAMSQLQQMKSFGGLTSTAQMPSFTPNPMKTKTLFSRIQYGANIQFLPGSTWYPSTSDVGLQVAYLLNKGNSIGVGASYDIGLGENYQHISLSSQGVGLRSFLNYKIKGSWFITGGLEKDYNASFGSLKVLYTNVSLWTNSILAGIEKQYQISGKIQGTAMLVYDFLYRSHVPPTQPFSFRTGYNF